MRSRLPKHSFPSSVTRRSKATAEPLSAAAHRACTNCDAVLAGPHCHACGQEDLGSRLTLRVLAREFVERVLNVERGLARTALDLAKSPGRTSLDYVRGRRQRYVNPSTYFMLAAGASLLVFSRADAAQMDEMMRNVESTYGLSSAQQARFVTLKMASLESEFAAAVQSLFLAFVMALLWRAAFRRSGFNIAETTVASLYATAQILVLSLVIGLGVSAGEWAGGVRANPMGEYALGILYMPALFGWTAATFFPGPRARTVAVTVGLFVVGLVAYSLVSDGLLAAYVLLTG